MDLRVLGPVEAVAGDQPIAIGAGKARALLAMPAPIEAWDVRTRQRVRRLPVRP